MSATGAAGPVARRSRSHRRRLLTVSFSRGRFAAVCGAIVTSMVGLFALGYRAGARASARPQTGVLPAGGSRPGVGDSPRRASGGAARRVEGEGFGLATGGRRKTAGLPEALAVARSPLDAGALPTSTGAATRSTSSVDTPREPLQDVGRSGQVSAHGTTTPVPSPRPRIEFAARSPRSGYGLQLGAYRTEEEARAVLRPYAASLEGMTIFMTAAKVRGEQWFRVRTGRFRSRSAAKKKKAGLPAELGAGAMVVRYR